MNPIVSHFPAFGFSFHDEVHFVSGKFTNKIHDVVQVDVARNRYSRGIPSVSCFRPSFFRLSFSVFPFHRLV